MLWYLNEEKGDLEYQERILKEEINKKNYLQVLNTLEWKIPIEGYKVQLTTTTISKIDILRKMIMKLIRSDSPKSMTEIKEILNVDPLFIKDVVDYLLFTGLAIIDEEAISLSQIGEKQYQAGTILSDPKKEVFSFNYSTTNDSIVPIEEKNDYIQQDFELEEYRFQNERKTLIGEVLEEERLRSIIKKSGAVFEVGGKEKIISGIEPLVREQVSYAKCIEFQLYDVLEDKAYAKVWNGALGMWDSNIEEEINNQESTEWKSTYVTAVSERFPERYKMVKQKLQETGIEKQPAGNINIIRGLSIRKRFDRSFIDTKKKMLMVSPWISESVVDKALLKKFKEFANQNKTMYISWGIAKRYEKEDRKPSEFLLNQIRSIKHPDGTQAIFIRWFGNQHNKELVIDNQALLLGSYNWLSYRGDYNLRQESVLEISDSNIIEGTTEFIEKNFIEALENEMELLLKDLEPNWSTNDFKNWMKEIIILSSFTEKRISISNKLIEYLKEKNELNLVHELAILWAVYDTAEFGIPQHLADLLEEEEEGKALSYLGLCQQHIKTFQYLKIAPELLMHNEWVEKNSRQPQKEKKSSKNGKRKK